MHRDDVFTTLARCKRDFGAQYGILEIGIFGSLARGEADSVSDVDVCLKTKTANLYNLFHIKDAREKLTGRQVDIVRIREQMNPFLKEHIEREGH